VPEEAAWRRGFISVRTIEERQGLKLHPIVSDAGVGSRDQRDALPRCARRTGLEQC